MAGSFCRICARAPRKVVRYTAGMNAQAFFSDEMVVDAVVRNLEIIGEAAKHVPDDLRTRYPTIDWRKLAGLRDVIAHAYCGLDEEILWAVVTSKVPALLGELQRYGSAPEA